MQLNWEKHKNSYIGIGALIGVIILLIIQENNRSHTPLKYGVQNQNKIDSLSTHHANNFYQLIIDPDNYNILSQCRQKALAIDLLADSNQIYVDAVLKINVSSYDVKVRLKGRMPSHWKHPEKWSFRVVIKDGVCKENGLKVFSIQNALQRGNLAELYYQHLLKLHGVIGLNYNYINLSVNGKVYENYVIEEFFDTPMLINNGRIPGPILKFDFSQFWESINWKSSNLPATLINQTYDSIYNSAPIIISRLKSDSSPIAPLWSNDVVFRLDQFRAGALKANELFDIPLFAEYFAINTLFGNQHSSYLTNLRFYFNPQTLKLEPIGYDLERVHELKNANKGTKRENFWPHLQQGPQFVNQLFADTLLKEAYINSLNQLVKNNEVDQLISNLQSEIDMAYANHPKRNRDYIKILNENLIEIKKLLESNE